jgi:hypothetical protein
MGILGSYPAHGHRVNPDDVLAECYKCGEQRMYTREFIAMIPTGPRCRSCNDNNVWLWIRNGLESQAPRIEFGCTDDGTPNMPWEAGE